MASNNNDTIFIIYANPEDNISAGWLAYNLFRYHNGG
jgi:hypothetical protein